MMNAEDCPQNKSVCVPEAILQRVEAEIKLMRQDIKELMSLKWQIIGITSAISFVFTSVGFLITIYIKFKP